MVFAFTALYCEVYACVTSWVYDLVQYTAHPIQAFIGYKSWDVKMRPCTQIVQLCLTIVFLSSFVPGNWGQLVRTELTLTPQLVWLGEPFEFKCKAFPENIFLLTARIYWRRRQRQVTLNNYVGIRPWENDIRAHWTNRTVVHVENNNTMYARVPSARYIDDCIEYQCELRDTYSNFKSASVRFTLNVKPYNVSIIYNNINQSSCDKAIEIPAETQDVSMYCDAISKPNATFVWTSGSQTLRPNDTKCERADNNETFRCMSPITVDVGHLTIGMSLRVKCLVSCVTTTDEEDKEVCVEFKKVETSSAALLTFPIASILWIIVGMMLAEHN